MVLGNRLLVVLFLHTRFRHVGRKIDLVRQRQNLSCETSLNLAKNITIINLSCRINCGRDEAAKGELQFLYYYTTKPERGTS
jgi:hypothetical protein